MSLAERVHGPIGRFTFPWAALLLLQAVAPIRASGQRVPEGFSDRGIQIIVNDQSYTLQGSTARELLEQMQVLRRGGRSVMFPWLSRWNYSTYNLRTPNGRASTRCGIQDFEIRFEVEAVYPRWNHPDDASEELVAAWEVYQDQIFTYWEERRQYIINLARQTSRRMDRMAEACQVVGQRANDLVRDLTHQPDPEERASIGDRPSLRLRWPPEGYEDLIRGPLPTRQPRPASVTRPPKDEFPEHAGLDVSPSGMVGVVGGLQRHGESEYMNAFGFADPEEEEPLTPHAVFRFPAFTEVVVATLASRVSRDGLINLQAPLSSYLPELDERLGAVTLAHLLSHRSGIDDANPMDEVWSEILDALDDGAMFTDPGAVFSYSRYDYPLAVRVLERVLGAPLETELASRVFEPFGMENTFMGDSLSGLPILQTTAPDVLSFWAVWMESEPDAALPMVAGDPSEATRAGEVAASQVAATGPAGLVDHRGRWFDSGMWRDQVGDQPRLSLMCAAGLEGDAVALQIFPDSSLSFVLGARPRALNRVWPTVLSGILLEEVGSNLGVGKSILGPKRLRGDGETEPGPRPCVEPAWSSERVDNPGSPAPTEEWAGRYMNGDRVFELVDREGTLAVAVGGDLEFAVTHFDANTYFATMAERPLWPFRLVRDEVGRRYAVVGNRAHLHDDDRPGG